MVLSHNRLQLRRFTTMLRDHIEDDRAFLLRLRGAWGNEAFSADVSYLQQLIRRVRDCRGPILECGSGLTTVLAERTGATVWSLEQDETWARHLERALVDNRIERVRLLQRPLRSFDQFLWYDVETLDLPRHFPLVLCDGPAVFQDRGETFYRSWRYGVQPILSGRAITFGEMLVHQDLAG